MKLDYEAIKLKNILSLAYLGDAVFSLMVRQYLVENHDLKPSGLNARANKVVCAKTQSLLLDEVKNCLTEQENEIILRARNSHNHPKAKHSTVEEYNKATQFEALFGYLYLNGDYDRLNFIFNSYVVGKL